MLTAAESLRPTPKEPRSTPGFKSFSVRRFMLLSYGSSTFKIFSTSFFSSLPSCIVAATNLSPERSRNNVTFFFSISAYWIFKTNKNVYLTTFWRDCVVFDSCNNNSFLSVIQHEAFWEACTLAVLVLWQWLEYTVWDFYIRQCLHFCVWLSATVCLTLLYLPLFLLHAHPHHRIHMTIQANVGTTAILSVKHKRKQRELLLKADTD